MATLEARRLQMRFGDRVVLEDISLTFPDRAFTGIMGPNGAGKTTSFNVLTGRYRPTRGQVLLDGEDITGLPPRIIARPCRSRRCRVPRGAASRSRAGASPAPPVKRCRAR